MNKEGENMFRYAASRCVVLGITILLVLGVAAAPGLARMQAPPTSALSTGKPPVEQTTMGTLQGAIKDVHPGAGTLQVSTGPFGIFWKTLDVTGDTHIQVGGRRASLTEIREGATVKASYETRETKNVATRIEVIPTQEGGKRAKNSLMVVTPVSRRF